MTLDIPTVFVLFILNSLLIAALLGVSFRGRRTAATDLWIASLLMQSITWVLFLLRGKLPEMITVVLASGMLSLSWAMLTEAFCRMLGIPVKRYWVYLPPVLTFVVMWWNLDSVAHRNIAAGLVFSAQYLAIATLIITRTDKWQALRTFIGMTAIVMAIMYLARVGVAFRNPEAITVLTVASPLQTATFLVGDAARLAFTFGFLLLIEAQRSDELKRLSVIDPLTGAYNRRTFMEMAEREMARVRRNRLSLGLMFLDIDHFKSVNDTHGHVAGDVVLRQITEVAERCLRQHDVFARYGGEEFCVLLPDTELAGAQVLAERMRGEIENCALLLPGGEPLRITASIGVSAISAGMDAVELDILIAQADRALYRAKELGRNRIVATEMVMSAAVAG